MGMDIIARGIASKALAMAESGSGKNLQSIEIDPEGNLVVTFIDGSTSNLGKVVGADGKTGKVYVPHINNENVLSWTVEDKEGAIPNPIDLTNNGEWSDINGQGKTQYEWDEL